LNQTTLLDELVGFDDDCGCSFSFDWEDVENLYPDPSSWDITTCVNWLEEHGVDQPHPYPTPTIKSWADLINDYAEPAEILEWWAISSHFADKLREHGECILDNDYGIWWGRTTSGQSVTMDRVIQAIAVEVLG